MLGNRSNLGRGRDPGSITHSLSLSLPIHVLDTAATSQDGSIFRMQGTEGCAFPLSTSLPADSAFAASLPAPCPLSPSTPAASSLLPSLSAASSLPSALTAGTRPHNCTRCGLPTKGHPGLWGERCQLKVVPESLRESCAPHDSAPMSTLNDTGEEEPEFAVICLWLL